MNNVDHCKLTVTKIVAIATGHAPAELQPSIVDFHYFADDGDYTTFTALVRIPYDRGGKKGIGHTESIYNFFVRRLGSSSGAYICKVLLRTPDEFMGHGDFDSKPSKARYTFEDDLRCSTDALKSKGTIACWRSIFP